MNRAERRLLAALADEAQTLSWLTHAAQLATPDVCMAVLSLWERGLVVVTPPARGRLWPYHWRRRSAVTVSLTSEGRLAKERGSRCFVLP